MSHDPLDDVFQSGRLDYDGDDLKDTVTLMRIREDRRLRSWRSWASLGGLMAMGVGFFGSLFQAVVVPPQTERTEEADVILDRHEDTREWAPRNEPSSSSSPDR